MNPEYAPKPESLRPYSVTFNSDVEERVPPTLSAGGVATLTAKLASAHGMCGQYVIRLTPARIVKDVRIVRVSSGYPETNVEMTQSQWFPDQGDYIIELKDHVQELQLQCDVETDRLAPGLHLLEATIWDRDGMGTAGQPLAQGQKSFVVQNAEGQGMVRPMLPLTVRNEPVAADWTSDAVLSLYIKESLKGLDFNSYQVYMDYLLCGVSNFDQPGDLDKLKKEFRDNPKGALTSRRFLPFTDTDAYRFLKIATEAFVIVKSAVCNTNPVELLKEINLAIAATGARGVSSAEEAAKLYKDNYLKKMVGPNADNSFSVLPYLALVASKLTDQNVKQAIFGQVADISGENPVPIVERCVGILREKLECPIMIELIWSYWHEQGMQVQSMHAIRNRFQNRRTGPAPDPLASMEMGMLRPLNNILWGYIQDEQHRLTIARRTYEYDHHYGLTLQGKAVQPLEAADSRSKFLEAFHNLLNLCTVFFKQDDDTQRKADGFPVLNAIKEVHFLLSEGAHNQFGDLPTTSRIEMLMEQWLLARPEMAQFLPSRESVAYPEPWMGTVDAMKSLQGWTNTSAMYFHDLGKFGEQLLLSIRYNNWSQISQANNAVIWARIWRREIQGYIHAYRTVTGVDLSVEPTEVRLEERPADPSVLILRRLEEQRKAGTAVRSIGHRLPSTPTAVHVTQPRRIERR